MPPQKVTGVMARARNLKPQFFTDAELVECEPLVRLLFAGLWTLADRRGILADKPKQIKMDLFPSEAFDVEAGLTELDKRGLIRRYQSQDGIRCIKVVNFAKHQNPHKDEKSSELPDEPTSSTVLTPGQHPVNRADSLNTDSLVLDSSPRIDDSLSSESLTPDPPAAPASASEDDAGFIEFWKRYPRKEPSRKEALRAWGKVKAPTSDVLDGLERWLPVWETRGDPSLIPHATTWLNQERWTVEHPSMPVRGSPANGRASSEDQWDKALEIVEGKAKPDAAIETTWRFSR